MLKLHEGLSVKTAAKGRYKMKAMKVKLFLILILNFLFVKNTVQSPDIFLVKPNESFKSNILDPAVKESLYPTDIIMLEVEKIAQDSSCKACENYVLKVTSIGPNEFRFFSLHSDKYYGYFEYKDRIVLVYSEDVLPCFFSRSEENKHFDFLSYQHSPNDPPISLEPIVYTYILKCGNLKLMTAARTGFYR